MKSAVTDEPLIRLENAARYFDVSSSWLDRVLKRKTNATLKAVDGVSFDIHRGETLALVGESGCGKSTVARLLVGLYALSHGAISFEGQSIAMLATREGRHLRQRLQMIFQDPYASLDPRWSVGRNIAEPLRTHHPEMSQADVDARIDHLLQCVGLTSEDKGKYPHQFSGGQRQRISIARALATRPDFLVCDEPTSALDVSVQAQVLNLMKDLQREMGLTYLFISHNLAVVHHIADRVGVMYLGRLVEIAPKRDIFARPRHPYTRMLLDAIPDLNMTGKSRTPVAGEVPNPLNPPSGCGFHPRCPHANERCRQETPMPLLQGAATVACHAVQENRI